MQIRVRTSGAVMFDHEFRQLHQGLGLPAVLTEEVIKEWGGDIVLEGPQASGGTVYQYSMRSGVREIEGKWYTNYILGPVFTDTPATDTQPAKTAAENEAAYQAMKDVEQAANVRRTRTDKLKDCDWTQIADSTADKTAWATYRQALRDITGQAGFPWTITWPNDPNWVAPTV
jgi:hypothetical protein